jgi:hypothetical protein
MRKIYRSLPIKIEVLFKIANVVLGCELMLLFYWVLNFLRSNIILNIKIGLLTLLILGGLYLYSEYQMYHKSSVID